MPRSMERFTLCWLKSGQEHVLVEHASWDALALASGLDVAVMLARRAGLK